MIIKDNYAVPVTSGRKDAGSGRKAPEVADKAPDTSMAPRIGLLTAQILLIVRPIFLFPKKAYVVWNRFGTEREKSAIISCIKKTGPPKVEGGPVFPFVSIS